MSGTNKDIETSLLAFQCWSHHEESQAAFLHYLQLSMAHWDYFVWTWSCYKFFMLHLYLPSWGQTAALTADFSFFKNIRNWRQPQHSFHLGSSCYSQSLLSGQKHFYAGFSARNKLTCKISRAVFSGEPKQLASNVNGLHYPWKAAFLQKGKG